MRNFTAFCLLALGAAAVKIESPFDDSLTQLRSDGLEFVSSIADAIEEAQDSDEGSDRDQIVQTVISDDSDDGDDVEDAVQSEDGDESDDGDEISMAQALAIAMPQALSIRNQSGFGAGQTGGCTGGVRGARRDCAPVNPDVVDVNAGF